MTIEEATNIFTDWFEDNWNRAFYFFPEEVKEAKELLGNRVALDIMEEIHKKNKGADNGKN